ncbi:hypothetical protein GCM10009809_08300 [Isoptericola hypogeus]|uniref:Uncharacterized protein n=1 Tax=Isoptericola hypogeus TaxID=300179 RepID=A0ABP4UYM8_9MICO
MTVVVTVVDLAAAADVLQAEADENTQRKGLTPYEASRARERRAKVLAPKAAEAKREHGGTAPGRTSTGANLAPVSARKTRNVAATGTGYSGSTLDKVDTIRDAAEALALVAQGKRSNGRWARGSVPATPANGGSSISGDGWIMAMKQVGAVYDALGEPGLTAVLRGHVSLNAAVEQARIKLEDDARVTVPAPRSTPAPPTPSTAGRRGSRR